MFVLLLPYLLDYTPPSNKRPPPLRGQVTAQGFYLVNPPPALTGPYIPYCLVVTPCSLLRPPPLFSGEITVKGYFTSITRPPRGPLEPVAVLQFCTCTRVASVEELYLCIKRVENSLRTGLGLFR